MAPSPTNDSASDEQKLAQAKKLAPPSTSSSSKSSAGAFVAAASSSSSSSSTPSAAALAEAESLYREVLAHAPESGGEQQLKNYETALAGLGQLLRDQNKAAELAELIAQTRDVLSSFAKAKTAKLGAFLLWMYSGVSR